MSSALSRGALASTMLAGAATAAASAAAGLHDWNFIAGPACVSLVGVIASVVIGHSRAPEDRTAERADCLSCSCGMGSACCFQAGLPQNWIAVVSVCIECVQLCSIAAVSQATSAAILTGSVAWTSNAMEQITLVVAFAIAALLLLPSCVKRRAAWVGSAAGAAVLPVSCRLARAALDARRDETALFTVAAVAAASAWSVVAAAAVFASQRRERRDDIVAYAPWFSSAEIALKAALALVATVCADVGRGERSSAWALILAGMGCTTALFALLCFRPCTVAAISEVRCVALLAALWAFLCAAAVELVPLLQESHRAQVVALFGGWLAVVLFPGFGWVCWHARAVAQTRPSTRDSSTGVGSTSETLARGAEERAQ